LERCDSLDSHSSILGRSLSIHCSGLTANFHFFGYSPYMEPNLLRGLNAFYGLLLMGHISLRLFLDFEILGPLNRFLNDFFDLEGRFPANGQNGNSTPHALGNYQRLENGSQNALNIFFATQEREDAIPVGFGSLVNAEPVGVESDHRCGHLIRRFE
jgi:hypothetical protein